MTEAVVVLALLVVVDIVVSHRRFTAIEARLAAPAAAAQEPDPEPLPSMTRTQKRERLERAARKRAQESRAAR